MGCRFDSLALPFLAGRNTARMGHLLYVRALECTVRIGFYRALIAGLEFSLTTHFLLGISSHAPNEVISCMLLALYSTLQDQV